MKVIATLKILFLSAFLLNTMTPAATARTLVPSGVSDTLDVLNYDIRLDIVHLSTKTISGYTDIKLTSQINNVSKLNFKLLAMTIDSVLINGIQSLNFVYNDTNLSVYPGTAINTGDTIMLRVCYHGHPQEDGSWGGFYFTSDSSYAFNIGVAFTSDPHCYGRVWFPCIDEFVDRATYDCHIRVKNTNKAVCGGTLVSVTDHGDGSATWYWRLNSSIPSYLASVAVADLACVSDVYNGIGGPVPIKIYAKWYDTTDVKNGFINLKNILAVFENRFGPFRWERVGYVGVPFSSGAMEHATNIAYPNAALDGSLSYEYLYAHELSHHWFGDLVTCRTAADMWINEGWGTFSESVFFEGIYGAASCKAYTRDKHKDVVQFCHVEDGSYLALYGIPHNYTYGKTVYDKGSDVVHTLRGYLGDSIFFNAVKAWTAAYAFKPCSSAELRDFLTAQTGVDMHDFFEAWIFNPGFPHFSIDSFQTNGNNVTVYVRQRLDHAPAFANSNILEITFMNNNWQQYTDTIKFSGQNGSKTFNVPFAPDFVMIDKEEKISDATTDNYQVIKSTGVKDFPTTYCVLSVSSVSDSAFVRVEHNFVAPDPFKIPDPTVHRLSNYRYWKIDGIFPQGFVAAATFKYNRTNSPTNGYLDNVLLPTGVSVDSLILLYRRNAADDWKRIPFTRTGGTSAGSIKTDTLKPGEYTFAVGIPQTSGIESQDQKSRGMLEVFPNPSNNSFTFSFDEKDAAYLRIYDSSSREVENIRVKHSQKSLKWMPHNNAAGTYFVKLISDSGKVIDERTIILTK